MSDAPSFEQLAKMLDRERIILKDRIAELEAQFGTKCTRCERPITDGCICGKCLGESNAAREIDLRTEQSRVMELDTQVKELVKALEDSSWLLKATTHTYDICEDEIGEQIKENQAVLAKHKGGG